MEPLSPELALVDERIDRSGRPASESPEPPTTASRRSERVQVARRQPVLTLWGALLVALAVGISALLLVRAEGPRTTATPANAAADTPAQGAAAGLELRWKPVPGATLYNVILWKDGDRVLDLWPASASIHVPKKRLEPGTYQWFVYPLLGEGEGRRYGEVAARGTLRV